MKIFIKKTLTFFGLFTLLLIVFLSLRIEKTLNVRWKLSKNINTLFLGASHIQRGINDSIYIGGFNLADGSERYLFTYLKLKNLLASNSNIDSVFLEFAPTDIWLNTDSKYYSSNEMSKFLPMYFPFFSWEEWKVYMKMGKIKVLSFIGQKALKNIPKDISDFGGFSPSNRIFNSSLDKYTARDWAERGHKINYKYLEKITALCYEKKIKLIFIYMPMYRPENFYDQKYYYSTYKKQFSNVELLDFSGWDCPDSLRADEHHLNSIGANRFTKMLYDSIKKPRFSNNKFY
ncbi:hypothetical protein [Zunongwangia profunda]|jgi:hypothetical protein|uniref:hypothetical protein n=1 Tax=Zunongwangia profunda TaxID=398743 RepID=UPI001D183C7E|nr:hypothetical protein [Zunongwangia profunda]MCC4229947.1 hypothetical protein [Zunongwangia profunda]